MCYNVFECVGGNCRVCACECAFEQFACCENAVGYLNLGYFYGFLAFLGVEGEVKLALLHVGHVFERVFHCVVAANLVGYGLVVAFYLFALECGALSFGGLSGIFEHRGYGYHCFALHVFFGEAAVDCNVYLSCLCFQGRGCYSEIVGRERAHFAA